MEKNIQSSARRILTALAESDSALAKHPGLYKTSNVAAVGTVVTFVAIVFGVFTVFGVPILVFGWPCILTLLACQIAGLIVGIRDRRAQGRKP